MPENPDDPDSASTQTDLSPWEAPERSGTDTGDVDTGTDESTDDSSSGETEETVDGGVAESEQTGDGSDGAASSFGSVDWDRRELGDSYPADSAYHCNECNDFHADSLRELKEHIDTDCEVTWDEYLEASGLHRCAGCGECLSSLSELYCERCSEYGDDRISCRNCGAVRVNVSDPFCSAGCAGERIEATSGAPSPLTVPNNPSDEWLSHPHRLPTGIPSGAPFIENHEIACRECYEYGADSLHSFAVHVSERHDFGWGGYIEKYALRRCRVCGDSLESLLPLYCSDVCQRSDPEPVRTCKREGCGAAVERRQKYCTRKCYKAADT